MAWFFGKGSMEKSLTYPDRTIVINKHTNPDFDVWCGRGSIFGNPYEIGVDGTREQVIARYRKWFTFMLRDPIFVDALKNLKNKRLGCVCAPLECHVGVIKEWLDKNTSLSENVLDNF